MASSERDDFRRQLFAAKAERDDMAGLAERRQQEVERVSGEIRALTEQVGSPSFFLHYDFSSLSCSAGDSSSDGQV